MYAGDHREQFPASVKGASRYLAHQAKLFTCASDSARTPTNEIVDMTADNNSYGYRVYDVDSSGLRMSESSQPNQLLMCDKNGTDDLPTSDVEGAAAWGGNHKGAGGNVMFVDGHVEWYNSFDATESGTLDNDEWERMTATGGVAATVWEDDAAW
jgi:prepilin-type processing-associated H-X9-DG protein